MLQEISRARQHQETILTRPTLSTEQNNQAPTHPLNRAHTETNSLLAQQGAAASTAASTAASAAVGTQPALAGIKREASEAQLTDQQPVKVAKLHAESQSAHPHGHAGTYQQPAFTMGPSPQGAGPCLEPQTAHTVSHAEKYTALAQQIPSEQLPVSIEQQMLEQQAARLSSEAKIGPEAPFSIDTMPLKLESSPVPAASPSGSATPANAVPPKAVAAAACWISPKSEHPQEAIGAAPPTEWDACGLGSSSTSASVPGQPQAAAGGQSLLAAVKTEPQHLPGLAQGPKQMGTGDSSLFLQAAGAQMVKADPDVMLLGPRTEARRAVPTNLEASEGPADEPWLQPGLPEAALAAGLHAAGAVTDCTTRAEGRSWPLQGSSGQLAAPETKVLHADAGHALPHVKLRTSSSALGSSPPTTSVPVATAQPGQGSSSALSAASAAVCTVQAVAPPWTPTANPMARASAQLGQPAAEAPTAASSTPIERKPTNNAIQVPQHMTTDSVEPPCSPPSFSGTYVADLLAKRRQELLAQAGGLNSIPASNRHSSAGGTKPTQDA